MSKKIASSIYAGIRRAFLLLPLCLPAAPSHATAMNAGTIMEKMKPEERFSFIAGIVEGLAMSRYMQDGKKPEGMNCIYDWFYQHKENIDTVYDAMNRFKDYPPGIVVDLLVRKACPS